MERIAVTFTGRVKGWEGQRNYLEAMKTRLEESTGFPVDFFCSAGCYEEDFNAFVAAMNVVASAYHVYTTHLPIDSYVRLGPGTRPYNIFSQAFHMKRVGELITEYSVKHNYTYKILVRWRVDLVTTIPYTIALPILANTVYIPYGDAWGPGINDRCAYGDRESMLLLYKLYDSMEGFAKEGIPLQAELYLLNHIEKMGLKIQRYDFPMEFSSARL